MEVSFMAIRKESLQKVAIREMMRDYLKTMYTGYGDMKIAMPRNRNGDYEPQLIKKYPNTVTQDMEKILSMYAGGIQSSTQESSQK